MKKDFTVGLIVPTWNSKHHLKNCLTPFLNSPLNIKILIIDSSSTDGTVEEAKRLGVETLVIAKEEFNHGLTREKARRHLKTDIVIFTTDDAYAVSNSIAETLIKPLVEGKASISYARQIPKDGADFFESFPRSFNYPEKSHIRSLEDKDYYGAYTFFCSNSCAAYLNSALDEIGGFSDVIFGEDTVAVAKLLKKGHKIAYSAKSIVKHSHSYTLKQEFFRYYLMGKGRKQYQELLSTGSLNKRGSSFFKEMLKRLLKEKPYLVPYAIINTAAKFLGFKIGFLRSTTS
ncbi:MAG TPA: glycosyltransferase [Parachlamydiaceae bacterium]|nr:glycosyltransferase [Parachlamydiaceae bacterium]